jgi:uncharacterized protein (UPF0332 family)
VALPDDLLEQALHLAKRDRKRPKQANLRRAVSTAYYALFHLLVSEGVSYWKIERQRSAFARSFEHRKMKGVCKNSSYPNADLQAVLDAFVELQQARHSADYDYAKAFTRVEVNHARRSQYCVHEIPRTTPPGFCIMNCCNSTIVTGQKTSAT